MIEKFELMGLVLVEGDILVVLEEERSVLEEERGIKR